jgi:hypothetical protein
MALLATCPNCRQQMEFFGIAHYTIVTKGKSVGLSTLAIKKGRKATARWTACTRCPTTQAEDFSGRIMKVRTDKWSRKEIEDTFPTTREKSERNKKRKVASD